MVVNDKQERYHWAKCKFGCKSRTSKGRCESKYRTTDFRGHLRKYHSIVKGQQQLKTESNDRSSVYVVKHFNSEEDMKFYMDMIVQEYPFNMVEHELFQDGQMLASTLLSTKVLISMRKEIMDICMREKDHMYENFKTINCCSVPQWTCGCLIRLKAICVSWTHGTLD